MARTIFDWPLDGRIWFRNLHVADCSERFHWGATSAGISVKSQHRFNVSRWKSWVMGVEFFLKAVIGNDPLDTPLTDRVRFLPELLSDDFRRTIRIVEALGNDLADTCRGVKRALFCWQCIASAVTRIPGGRARVSSMKAATAAQPRTKHWRW